MNYNPLKDEENPENQTKKEIYRDLLQGILFYFIFAISFASNTKNISEKQCSVLLGWGKAAAFYLTMGFIMFCFVNPILACTIPSLKNLIAAIPEWIWANLLRYIRIFMYVWGGIIFLGLMISLGYGEKCGDLSSATGFFVFVVIVTLIVIGLCYCFVLSDVGYQTLDKAKNDVQNYGTIQEEKKVEKTEEEGKKDGEVQIQVKEEQIDPKLEIKVDDEKPVEGISQPK